MQLAGQRQTSTSVGGSLNFFFFFFFVLLRQPCRYPARVNEAEAQNVQRCDDATERAIFRCGCGSGEKKFLAEIRDVEMRANGGRSETAPTEEQRMVAASSGSSDSRQHAGREKLHDDSSQQCWISISRRAEPAVRKMWPASRVHQRPRIGACTPEENPPVRRYNTAIRVSGSSSNLKMALLHHAANPNR